MSAASDDPGVNEASPARWEGPFGRGLAVTLVPLGAWLVFAFAGLGPHSGPAAALIRLVGAAMLAFGILAFCYFAWRRNTRALAGGIGTGLLIFLLVFLGLSATLEMISSLTCGIFCFVAASLEQARARECHPNISPPAVPGSQRTIEMVAY